VALVLVIVVAVSGVPMAVVDVVHMLLVWHAFVAAPWSVVMLVTRVSQMRQGVLVVVPVVWRVRVPVVHIVDVAFALYARMTAAGAVVVAVVCVRVVIGDCHCSSQLC
jgi:hypothetical protein